MPQTEKEREYAKRYRADHRAEIAAAKRDWRKTEKGRLSGHGRVFDPLKNRAWKSISRRIRRGNIKRGCCVFCGKPDAHAHHEDYLKRLDVVWVCEVHHGAIHAGTLKVLPEHIVHIAKGRGERR